MQQQALDLPVTPRQDFDNFICCSGNQAALQFCQRLLDSGSIEQVLYLHGTSGSGKTHLLQAVADHFQVPLYQASDLPRALHQDDSACLIIDQLEALPEHPDQRGMVWEAFNRHYTRGKKILMAGRLTPDELPCIDEHLASRLVWGLVAHLDITDDHSRRMLIMKLARDRNIVMPEAVCTWLLTVLPRHAGALIEALTQLYRTALEQDRRITLPFTKVVLSERLPPSTDR